VQAGSVQGEEFLQAAVPLLLHTSLGNALLEYQTQSYEHGPGNALVGASLDAAADLQSFLRWGPCVHWRTCSMCI
jgi:hypothetical protein